MNFRTRDVGLTILEILVTLSVLTVLIYAAMQFFGRLGKVQGAGAARRESVSQLTVLANEISSYSVRRISSNPGLLYPGDPLQPLMFRPVFPGCLNLSSPKCTELEVHRTSRRCGGGDRAT